MSKKHNSRKKQVAERYCVDERTVDRMVKDGRLPPPFYLPGGRIPFWDDDVLDANDRAAALRSTKNVDEAA